MPAAARPVFLECLGMVRPDARQEAELQRVANNFVALYNGDVM